MIFVTGGTGMVGSHLLFHLTREGHEVTALKRKGSSIHNTLKIFRYYSVSPDLMFSRIKWVDGDICDFSSLASIMEKAGYVYHTAALVSFVKRDYQEMMKINVQGTKNIVNACLANGVKKLCHVSSIAAMGDSENGELIHESTSRTFSSASRSLRSGESGYSISKYHAELEVWRGMEEGLQAVIVNPSVILGPGDWNKGSAALFSTVKNGLKYYTLGSTGFVDVRDLCRIMYILMKSNYSGEQFVLSAENHTYRELFTLIASGLNKKVPSVYASPFLSAIAWRAEWLRSLFTGRKPLITRSSVVTAHKKLLYSPQKIRERLSFEFIPFDETIRWISEIFLRERLNSPH